MDSDSFEEYVSEADKLYKKLEEMSRDSELDLTKFDECLQRAIESYEKALKINPKAKGVWLKLARLYHNYFSESPQLDNALKCYLNALGEEVKILKDLGELFLMRSFSHGRRYNRLPPSNDYEWAILCFSLYLLARPEDHEAWIDLADTYLFQNRYSEAQQYYDKALEIKPDDPRALSMAAWNAYEMRDHKKAIQLLERYCQLSPTNSYPWMELARIYEQHRNYKKAISCMEEAVKREPNNWVIWEDLGRYYFMAGDDTKAVACRSKAMELKAKYRPKEGLNPSQERASLKEYVSRVFPGRCVRPPFKSHQANPEHQ